MYLFIGIGIMFVAFAFIFPLIFKHQNKRTHSYSGYQSPKLAFATADNGIRPVARQEVYAQAVQYTHPVKAVTQEVPVSSRPVRHTDTREYTVTGVKVIPSKPRYQVIRTMAS